MVSKNYLAQREALGFPLLRDARGVTDREVRAQEEAG
jgi:hypothetical protein